MGDDESEKKIAVKGNQVKVAAEKRGGVSGRVYFVFFFARKRVKQERNRSDGDKRDGEHRGGIGKGG